MTCGSFVSENALAGCSSTGDSFARPRFSAVIVACNEARRLPASIASLSFCDDVVVVDLDSEDGSAEVATRCGAEVHRWKRVPLVELVREQAFGLAQHEWVIHIDPDEIFPTERLEELLRVTEADDVGVIRLPWSFYYRGTPLKGTVWGGDNSKPVLFHRRRIRLSRDVHVPIEALDGFREVMLGAPERGVLRHFWMDSFAQLLEKHLRYLRMEGEKRHRSGERFSWCATGSETLMALHRSLVRCKGWCDGPRGVMLSFFYGWYIFMSYLSLRRYQQRLTGSDGAERVERGGLHG